MQKTENFELNQWESHDPIRRADFNSDNAAIDAAIAANARALSDYRTANDAAVAKKAEQSAVTALETAVAGKGNCRIAYGSYTGTGESGEDYPNKLSFDFYPVLVVVNASAGGSPLTLQRPATRGGGMTGMYVRVTWADNGVSWYLDGTGSQYNDEKKYVYTAFGVNG